MFSCYDGQTVPSRGSPLRRPLEYGCCMQPFGTLLSSLQGGRPQAAKVVSDRHRNETAALMLRTVMRDRENKGFTAAVRRNRWKRPLPLCCRRVNRTLCPGCSSACAIDVRRIEQIRTDCWAGVNCMPKMRRWAPDTILDDETAPTYASHDKITSLHANFISAASWISVFPAARDCVSINARLQQRRQRFECP